MSTWCSKHVEAWNKCIIKFSPSSWLILINKYIEMHGQKNIKIYLSVCYGFAWPNRASFNKHRRGDTVNSCVFGSEMSPGYPHECLADHIVCEQSSLANKHTESDSLCWVSSKIGRPFANTFWVQNLFALFSVTLEFRNISCLTSTWRDKNGDTQIHHLFLSIFASS